MLKFAALPLFLCVGLAVQAQTIAQRANFSNSVSPLYIKQHEEEVPVQLNTTALPGARKKISGMVMAGVGGGLQAYGLVLIRQQRENDKDFNSHGGLNGDPDTGIKGVIGVLSFISGTVLGAAGGALWWTGSVQVKKARNNTQQSLRYLRDHPEKRVVTLNLRGGAVGIAYRL